MSEKDITKFLKTLGLSKREIQIYLFLAKNGVQSTSYAAKRLKMERVQAYRTFKKLQEKGFIEATIERPTRFSIVPFESLLESFIASRRSEVDALNEQKESLLSSWRNVSIPESEYAIAKFSVISGKKKIHLKMLNMIEESTKGISLLTPGPGLIQEDFAGVFDAFEHPTKKRNIQLRIITEISKENLSIVERMNKKFSAGKVDIECRHLSLDFKLFPRFLIKDEEEAILYGMTGDEPSMLKLEDEGLWINDNMFISILIGFFEQLWQTATDATQRIHELKTGIPISETMVIKDPEEALDKVLKTLGSAKEDIIAITSSQGINNILENDIFSKYCKKGLKCRLMAPLDLDNLEAARKLSETYEIKHVPINFLTLMLVDNKFLFMFKSPPLNKWTSDAVFYMGDTFYTNDSRSIERVSEMLNDAWKRGMEISQLTSQPEMKLPAIEVSTTATVSRLVGEMLRCNVESILITENGRPIGVISDREVLREIVDDQKDPEKTLAGELTYTPLITLEENQSMVDALKAMHERGATRVAVVKNGQLVSMLTEDLDLAKKGISIKTRALRK